MHRVWCNKCKKKVEEIIYERESCPVCLGSGRLVGGFAGCATCGGLGTITKARTVVR